MKTTNCTAPQCDRIEYAKGLCTMHYQRMRNRGTLDSFPVGRRTDVPPPLSLCEADLAWLAGLLEGEGSFIMSKTVQNGVLYLYPQIRVGMTDLDVIERVARAFGGVAVVSYQGTRFVGEKQMHQTAITGHRAVKLMEDLLPWMGVRRQAKIKELLDAPHGRIENCVVSYGN